MHLKLDRAKKHFALDSIVFFRLNNYFVEITEVEIEHMVLNAGHSIT